MKLPLLTSRFWIVAAMVVVPACANAARLDVDGVWLTADRDGQVEIRDCGNRSPCGRLVWFDPAKGSSRLDSRNRVTQLRQRQLMGVPIFWGFERQNNKWIGGNIYNPEDGKTFKSRLRLGGDDQLIVTGCLGAICITRIWTRIGS
jgi:uncharacterized protein (DUF2147 family)